MQRPLRHIVIGSAGQDGRILTEQLAAAGESCLGITRTGVLSSGIEWSDAIDVGSYGSVERLIRETSPDRVYYLAAYHHSSEQVRPEPLALYRESQRVNTDGVLHVLEAVRQHAPEARVFYASSSHVFGRPSAAPQTETSPFAPESFYGISKAAGARLCQLYRRTHGVFASVGIFYNHESPYRKKDFVSQKIVTAAREVKHGRRARLGLRSLRAEVDWGYAPDYMRAARMILDHESPDDFVVATGRLCRVQDFVALAFAYFGLDWRDYVEEDPLAPFQSGPPLVGSAAKLMEQTGWQPEVGFEQMVEILCAAVEPSVGDR